MEICESESPVAFIVPLSTRISSTTTVLTGTSIYSFYTPITDDGFILSGNTPQLSPVPPIGFQVSASGFGLRQPCGVYCAKRVRSFATMVGVDRISWRGMNRTSWPCKCEARCLAEPLRMILSHNGSCHNSHCNMYSAFRM